MTAARMRSRLVTAGNGCPDVESLYMFGALTRSANRKSKNVHAITPLKIMHHKQLKQILKNICLKSVLPIDIGGHIYVNQPCADHLATSASYARWSTHQFDWFLIHKPVDNYHG
jgi:hypothetical protein